MACLSNLCRPRPVAIAKRMVEILAVLAVVYWSWYPVGVASAVELVDRNPFDPHRQPWKVPPPPPPALPALTPQDLQIDAIVSFGSLRGILAQLDGRLRGTLPANAAGKVRISVGQSFGAGYILESIDSNQVVVLGGSARYTIPIVRKVNRGSAPAPATLAVEQRAAPPVVAAAASPSNITPSTMGVASAPAPQAETTAAPTAVPGSPAPQPAPTPAPVQTPAVAPATPSQAPMSLLEAIQAAQAAARNQQNPSQPVANPFATPRK